MEKSEPKDTAKPCGVCRAPNARGSDKGVEGELIEKLLKIYDNSNSTTDGLEKVAFSRVLLAYLKKEHRLMTKDEWLKSVVEKGTIFQHSPDDVLISKKKVLEILDKYPLTGDGELIRKDLEAME
jgi:hypothetical protein